MRHVQPLGLQQSQLRHALPQRLLANERLEACRPHLSVPSISLLDKLATGEFDRSMADRARATAPNDDRTDRSYLAPQRLQLWPSNPGRRHRARGLRRLRLPFSLHAVTLGRPCEAWLNFCEFRAEPGNIGFKGCNDISVETLGAITLQRPGALIIAEETVAMLDEALNVAEAIVIPSPLAELAPQRR